jgi:hypothetical protein
MIRPRVMLSSIASSSATRSGWSRTAIALPSTAILMRSVRRARAAATMFGDGISP